MAVGRAFKIRKKDVEGYGYARPRGGRGRNLRRNPGVTAIAAINGRGAYRSARSSMAGVRGRKARIGRARHQLNSAQKRAFVAKMQRAKHQRNRGSSARRPGRAMAAGRSRLARNGGRLPLRRRKPARARSAAKYTVKFKKNRGSRKVQGRKSMRRLKRKTSRRRKPVLRSKPARRRRRSSASRATAAPRRRRRRRKVSAVAPKRRRVTRRRRKTAKAAAPRRRRKKAMRKNRWRGDSAGHARAARKGWRKRRKTRSVAPRRRRRRKAKAAAPRRRRRTIRRTRGKARRRRASRSVARHMAAANRRGYRLNRRRRRGAGRRRLKANRRRRGHRRNGRRAFRRNEGFMTTLISGAKLGGIAFLGLGAQKLASYVVAEQLLSRVIGKPEVAQAPAVSGLEALQPYRGLIGAAITFPVLAFIANKAVKDNATKVTVITGMALGLVHNLAVAILNKAAPKAAAMLSGYEDGTAARLSAMYGVGASIMPHYTPLSEYFTNGTSGYGEYFTNNGGMNGLGEYFTNGVSGLGIAPYEAAAGMGNYGQNPDMYEAAAGMGAQETRNTNHIDPNGDLERQLDIVEAAAGVGVAPYEAAAGLGDSIVRVPSANTWIPGTSDGALWAGTRAINRGQSATEMVPAGILQTDGGQGVFG